MNTDITPDKISASADVVVIGGGPAGLMAAAAAARAGKSVIVIEARDTIGGKIPVTGGGHCNMSAMADELAYYKAFGRNGRFISDALRRLPPSALMEFFGEIGLPCVAEASGKVFPASGKAGDVVDVFKNLLVALGVELWCGCRVGVIACEGGLVTGVVLADGRMIAAGSVILACGGYTYPSLGTRGDGYRLAGRLGHDIIPPRCALAGLHVSSPALGAWAGVTLEDVELSFAEKRRARTVCRGSVVVTHVGLSGPAAMDISTHVSAGLAGGAGEFALELNFTPDKSRTQWEELVNHWRGSDGAKNLLTLISGELGRSVGSLVMRLSGVDFECKAAHSPKDTAERIATAATAAALKISAVDPPEKAMVTAGGVSLKQVAPRTLGSKLVRGLYFAGELLDLDGPTGGYNLQWAFCSGVLAGESAAVGQ